MLQGPGQVETLGKGSAQLLGNNSSVKPECSQGGSRGKVWRQEAFGQCCPERLTCGKARDEDQCLCCGLRHRRCTHTGI